MDAVQIKMSNIDGNKKRTCTCGRDGSHACCKSVTRVWRAESGGDCCVFARPE